MAPIDFLHGLSLTSLVGYLVGWPAARLGPARFRALRFFAMGALAGAALLLVAGWAPGVALLFGAVGGALAAGVNDVVARAPLASPVSRPSLPSSATPAATPAPATPAPGAIAPATWSQGERASESLEDTDVEGEAADPEDARAEIYDPGSRTSTRIDAPDVVAHECRRCGTENGADARYCKKCSAPLVPWRCETCGHENDVDATFCEQCRESLPMLASPLDVEVSDE